VRALRRFGKFPHRQKRRRTDPLHDCWKGYSGFGSHVAAKENSPPIYRWVIAVEIQRPVRDGRRTTFHYYEKIYPTPHQRVLLGRGASINFWCINFPLRRMRAMRLEHFALQVPDPVAMADWYVKNLGCTVARSGGEPSHGRFLTVGSVLFEIYRNPSVSVPDYKKIEPLHLHIAFSSENLTADRDRLVKAGATVFDDIKTTSEGDEIMILRDPWSVPILFVKRADPML
jgi:glyoxylase I family protein